MALKLEYQKDYIIEQYNNKRSIKSIAEELDEYHQAVTSVIKKYIPSYTGTLNPGNLDYFKSIDSDKKAYFVGFIAADGAIVQSTQHKSVKSLTITLNKKDKYLLEELRLDIGCDHEVKDLKTKDQVRFVLSKKEHIQNLESLGITTNKSLTMPSLLKNIPEKYHKSFLRGYFDGDGSIFYVTVGINNKYTVSIRGTKDFLEDYVKVFDIDSYYMSTKDSIPNLSISSKANVLKLFSMYKQSEFHLKRKYELFEKFIKEKCQDKTISSPSIS